MRQWGPAGPTQESMQWEMWLFLIQKPGSPGKKISYALNQRLPEDIRIQLSEEVGTGLSSQILWTAKKLTSIGSLNRKFPVPTERLYSYFYHYKLDVQKMQEATLFSYWAS